MKNGGRFNALLVLRLVEEHRVWWNSVVPIIKFWSEVVHYRTVGNGIVKRAICK